MNNFIHHQRGRILSHHSGLSTANFLSKFPVEFPDKLVGAVYFSTVGVAVDQATVRVH
jgi:hypothetical protein